MRLLISWLRDFVDVTASGEDIAEGLETFPDTLLRLFKGENTGKLVLKLAAA